MQKQKIHGSHLSVSLSILTAIFQAKDGSGGNNCSHNRAKLESNHHHQQTNTKFFTGRMPFLSPNQQFQSTEGKNITFPGLVYPKLTWGLPTLSLTTAAICYY